MEPKHTTSDELHRDELVARVLYELLGPAARIAAEFGVPARELVRLLENAHFREVRRRSPTLRDAAERLGISARTAERLSKQSRETFVLPELEHHLPRRIEFLLAAAPMSAARLVQVLRDVEESDVLQALDVLIADGRVNSSGDRTVTYQPAKGVRSLPRDTWTARVGALGSFGENLSNAVWGRFFANDPASFARTLSFRVSRSAMSQLAEWYSEHVLAEVVRWSTEAESTAESDTVAMQLSLCWAPYEAMAQIRAESGESR